MRNILLLLIFICSFLAGPALAGGDTETKKPFEIAVDLLNAARMEEQKEVEDLLLRLKEVAPPPPEKVAEATAFWVNLYNGLVTWKKFLNPEGVHTAKGRETFFSKEIVALKVGQWSLDDIEHGVLRANALRGMAKHPQIPVTDPKARFVLKKVDPRIHGALNCGAVSCPPIAFYDPEHLEEQLDMAISNLVLENVYDPNAGELKISKIFDWYQEDFENPSLLEWWDRFYKNDSYQKARKEGKDIKIKYLEYKWK